MPRRAGPTDEGPELEADLDPDFARKIGEFRERLGLPRGPGFLDEGKAPPVDMELVRAYVERTLDSPRASEVFALSIKFRSWSQAVDELQIPKARQDLAGGPRTET